MWLQSSMTKGITRDRRAIKCTTFTTLFWRSMKSPRRIGNPPTRQRSHSQSTASSMESERGSFLPLSTTAHRGKMQTLLALLRGRLTEVIGKAFPALAAEEKKADVAA